MSFQRRPIVDTICVSCVSTSDSVALGVVLFSKSGLAPAPDFPPFRLKAALEWKVLSLASRYQPSESHQPENPQGTGLVSAITSMFEGHSLSRGKGELS